MKNTIKKTNTQLLKDIQNIVDDIEREKTEVEKRLQVIDSLEKKYYELIEEVKQNNKN
jgi:DNA repair ATPase RecN